MRNKILALAAREDLFRDVEHIVCAVSGGADSVALLHCLMDLRQEFGFTLSAAHYNHSLRGAESDEDEAFVRDLCQKWNIPLHTGRGDVAAHAARCHLSIEEAARNLRYGFLMSLPGHIAVAHHADDQIETVLINLIRGTGLRGLCGMAARQHRLLRPLLTVTAREIRAYLQSLGIPHREDSTNTRDDALRNRLRHHVIPLLYRENPSLDATVGRMTDLLRAEDTHLAREADDLLRAASVEDDLDCGILRAAPAVIRRRAIRSLLDALPNPSVSHVDAVEALLERANGSAEVHLPDGITVRREYDLLRWIPDEDREPMRAMALRQNAITSFPGCRIHVSDPKIPDVPVDQKTTFALKPGTALTVRCRQTGDVLRLPAGSKSVKKLMIDRKIPAACRDRIPVIAHEAGVAAVYGLGADRELTAAPGEPAIIVTILREETEQ